VIALAGTSAFGATPAIQGPLSNDGAGLSLILTRPVCLGAHVVPRHHPGARRPRTAAGEQYS